MKPIQLIIQECIQGDRAAEKQLYFTLVDDLLLVAERYTRDENFARDVVQNTFIRIFNNLKVFNPEIASINTWAKNICIYEAIAFLRKNKKFNQLVNIDEVILPFQHVQHEDVSIEELKQKIASLPEEHRTILNLYYYEELSHKEIGVMLQIKEVSSRSRLSRAREHLKVNWKFSIFLLLKMSIYGS